MGRRVTVTARQARLGTELRRMREAAGMSVRQAAESLGIDQAKISHYESGRSGVSEARLRQMAALYGCRDIRFIDGLVEMTGDRPKQWWDSYRGMLGQSALNLAELEHWATALRVHQGAYVPGLLQTEPYMRGVLSYAAPSQAQYDLDTPVSFRRQRARVLDRDPPLPFRAILHEAALRTRVADSMVARDQLIYLCEQSERPNVTILVVPFEAEYYGGAGHSMLYAHGRVPRLDTVHVDATPGAFWLDSPEQLEKYGYLLEKGADFALSAAASRNLMHRLARSFER